MVTKATGFGQDPGLKALGGIKLGYKGKYCYSPILLSVASGYGAIVYKDPWQKGFDANDARIMLIY